LAGNFSPTALVAYLRRRRTQVATHQAGLAKMTRTLDRETDLGLCLALDYGSELASAEMAWLDGTLSELSEQFSLEEAD
jgi:hypothetical protein